MKIITCNFRGRKHSQRNEPCEDSVNYILGSNITTVAVADGAGSKKYSHAKEGADAVTKAVCSFFEAKFDDFFDSSNELELRTVVQTICHKALKERAGQLGLDSIETMASTLLTVSVKGNKAICVQIGDGFIGRMVHGEPEPVTLPQNGEYASSTYFVNDAEAYKMIQVRKLFLSGTSHMFLMSDGIADCMFNDFTGEFNKSLTLLLETSDEPDGEEKVRKAVKEFIVDADPMSDDCTMAVVCLNNPVASVPKAKTELVEPEQPVNVLAEKQEKCQEPVTYAHAVQQAENTCCQVTSSDDSVMQFIPEEAEENKKGSAGKIIISTLAIILAIIIGAGVLIHFVTDKDQDGKNNDKTSTTTSSSTVSTTDPGTDDSSDENPVQSGSTLDVTATQGPGG